MTKHIPDAVKKKAIREYHVTGDSIKAIARRYGVVVDTIYKWRSEFDEMVKQEIAEEEKQRRHENRRKLILKGIKNRRERKKIFYKKFHDALDTVYQ